MCAIATTFWTSANAGEGMITATTTGDTQTPDPTRIPGSSIGAVPSAYRASAQAVYPVYDGVTEISGVLQSLAIDPQSPTGEIDYSRYPASFWSDLDPDLPPTSPDTLTLTVDPVDFTNWHSAFQAEYIVRLSEENGDDPPQYQIGPDTGPSAIYMLDDDNRPVNLLALTLSDYAKLSDAEKTRFNDNLVDSGHLTKLGMSTSATEKTALVTGTGDTSKPGLDEYLATIASSTMTAAQKLLFSTQIQMLKTEVNASYAFNAEKIRDAADEIMTRFNIVSTFISAVRPTTLTITGTLEQQRTAGLGYDFGEETESTSGLTKTKVNCLDGGETMDKGIEAFIRAETEILNMKQRRAVIAENSAYRDPNLDVPNLIYQLQLLYEGESKGVVDAGTEEFRQLHKLLEDYNVMQQLLSTTISYFDTGKTDEKRRFMNIGAKDDGDVDEEQLLTTAVDPNDSLNYNNYSESYSPSGTSISSDHNPRYHWSVLANFTDPLADMFRDYYDGVNDTEIDIDIDGDYSGKLSAREMLAFSMFADETWAQTSSRGHPIESLYGAERPKFDLVDQGEEGAGSLQVMSKNSFDQFQTQISNSITILNQQNQIKQNEVENASKEQNRHFELGNNALRKMNDLLLMIGRM